MTTSPYRLGLAILLAMSFAPVHAGSDVVWSDGFNDYIKLLPTDSGARNAHPATITSAQAKSFLQALRIKDDDNDLIPLFTKDEANYLSVALAKGLQQAGALQDLAFFSTARRGSFIMGPKGANTGRVFFSDGALNMIIGEAHQGYAARQKAEGKIPAFSFGNRTKAGKVILYADGMHFPGGDSRRDWIAWQPSDDAPAAAPSAAPAEPTTKAEPAPAARDGEFYAQQEERLRRLQDLRKKGLITDQEFEAKKQEILKDY